MTYAESQPAATTRDSRRHADFRQHKCDRWSAKICAEVESARHPGSAPRLGWEATDWGCPARFAAPPIIACGGSVAYRQLTRARHDTEIGPRTRLARSHR